MNCLHIATFLLGILLFASGCVTDFTLVRDRKAVATIVIAEKPTIAANLGALELQHHVRKITGTTLPIRKDSETIAAPRIFVGDSKLAAACGYTTQGFEPTEYQIQFAGEDLFLMGLDWDAERNKTDAVSDPQVFTDRRVIDYSKAVKNGQPPLNVTLPGKYEEQGTAFAVYAFLERYCGIRWFGPTDLNMYCPQSQTLLVKRESVRRFPSIRYREMSFMGWPHENFVLYNGASRDEMELGARRQRNGGMRWFANHSSLDGDWLTDEKTGDPLGFTDPRLVDKLVASARNFFDGKGLPAFTKKANCHVFAIGDYYAIVPNDSNLVVVTEEDKKASERSKADLRGGKCFARAYDSYYFFQLLNRVARELRKTHPDKKIATLAYAGYSYMPKGLVVEPNIAVAFCMSSCGYVEEDRQNDYTVYRQWAEWTKKSGAELFIWNYYHAPYESGLMRKYRTFPVFVSKRIAHELKTFVSDHVKGVFLCGTPLMPDSYLYTQLSWDASQNEEDILNEFFRLNFAGSEKAMREFYDLIQDIAIRSGKLGSDLKTAWGELGTEEVVRQVAEIFEKAEKLATSENERARIALWKKAFYENMVVGRKQYDVWLAYQTRVGNQIERFYNNRKNELKRLVTTKAPRAKKADKYIADVAIIAHSAMVSPYTLLDGFAMDEAVLGSPDATLKKNAKTWYGYQAKSAWLKLDLMKVQNLDRIIVYNHVDKARKAAGFTVQGSLTGKPGTWQQLGVKKFAGQDRVVIDCAAAKVRYLMIRLTSAAPGEYVGLGQIRVYSK